MPFRRSWKILKCWNFIYRLHRYRFNRLIRRNPKIRKINLAYFWWYFFTPRRWNMRPLFLTMLPLTQLYINLFRLGKWIWSFLETKVCIKVTYWYFLSFFRTQKWLTISMWVELNLFGIWSNIIIISRTRKRNLFRILGMFRRRLNGNINQVLMRYPTWLLHHNMLILIFMLSFWAFLKNHFHVARLC